jgi:uncharacterized protein (TIGR03084 family)
MEDVLGALAAQHDELGGLLADLDPPEWDLPSACEGWSISDVVLHLVQTDEMAVASLEDRLGAHLDEVASAWVGAGDVDQGAGRLVEAERGVRPNDLHERWLGGTATLRRRFTEREPSDRVTWVAGQLSVRTLATTRLAECWIHTGDVATGLGLDLPASDRLQHIARLAWRTIPYAFQRAGREAPGPTAFELLGPAGEPWSFAPEGVVAVNVVSGPALDLCRVAGQRAAAEDTALVGEGPDVEAVLALVRTFA